MHGGVVDVQASLHRLFEIAQAQIVCQITTAGRETRRAELYGDTEAGPIIMLLSEGQMSDHKGATLDALLPAKTLIADKGYDGAAFRQALVANGIEPR